MSREQSEKRIGHWVTVSVSTLGMVCLIGLSLWIESRAWVIPLVLAAAFPFVVMAVRDAIRQRRAGDSNG